MWERSGCIAKRACHVDGGEGFEYIEGVHDHASGYRCEKSRRSATGTLGILLTKSEYRTCVVTLPMSTSLSSGRIVQGPSRGCRSDFCQTLRHLSKSMEPFMTQHYIILSNCRTADDAWNVLVDDQPRVESRVEAICFRCCTNALPCALSTMYRYSLHSHTTWSDLDSVREDIR